MDLKVQFLNRNCRRLWFISYWTVLLFTERKAMKDEFRVIYKAHDSSYHGRTFRFYSKCTKEPSKGISGHVNSWDIYLKITSWQPHAMRKKESRISDSREMVLQWSTGLGSGIRKVCSIIQECIWLIISETQVHWSQQGTFLLHSKKPIGRLSIATHSYSSHELQSLDYFCLSAASLQQVLLSSWPDCGWHFSIASAMRKRPKRKGTSLGSCLSYQENIFDSILIENTLGKRMTMLLCSCDAQNQSPMLHRVYPWRVPPGLSFQLCHFLMLSPFPP